MIMDLRPRGALMILSVVFITWCLVLFFLTLQEYASEATAMKHEISLLREDNLRMNIALTDVDVLSAQLAQYLAPQQTDQRYNRLLWSDLSWETQTMLLNMTGLKTLPNIILPLPQLYDLLPHLINQSGSLTPELLIAKNPRKSDISMVLGIPTVKRDKVSYLMTTLQGFLSCMTLEEERDTLIIIFIAETDFEFVNKTANQIITAFPRQVSSGLIEMISPPAAFYPDWSTMKPTLGDNHARFKWRSKATLDYIFLMMYARKRGKYFVQLEDDIITKPNFITTMRETADNKTARNESWLVIAFSDLGFIGKLFRNSDLSFMIDFYAMFYKNQPVDWLLPRIIDIKLCRLDQAPSECTKLHKLLWIRYKPSLFQHIGKHSSLRGKIQDLRDSGFGTLSPFVPHNNPTATVNTSLRIYGEHTLERSYTGKDFFWSHNGSFGDHVTFIFQPPINISRYVFRSGNWEHGEDQFLNSTVEVISDQQREDANYTVIGSFNTLGIAEGFVNETLWPIKSLRILLQDQTKKWLILSEILLVNNATQNYSGLTFEINTAHSTVPSVQQEDKTNTTTLSNVSNTSQH